MNVERGSRRILMHGIAFILFGLLYGLVVPHTRFPRLAVGAHIQAEDSGMLFLLLALLLLKLPHRVGHKSIMVMLASVWLTWAMVLSEVANASWGTIQMLPIAAFQAGATGGAPWQEAVVKAAHIAAGFGLIAAWALLMLGFTKAPPAAASNSAT